MKNIVIEELLERNNLNKIRVNRTLNYRNSKFGKSFITTSVLVLLSTLLSTAQPEIDSLFSIWNNPEVADSIRVDAMNDISWNGYLFNKPDSAFYYSQLAYDLAEKNGLKRKMAGALNTQGASFWVRGIYPKALAYFEKSLALFEQSGDLNNAASCLNNMGTIFRNQGDNLKGLKYFLRSLQIREELGDKSGMPGVLNNIGLIYQDQEDYDNALAYYQKSLKIREELGDKDQMAGSLNNIGLIYQFQKDFDQALEYFQRSLQINREINNRKGEASSLNNLGIVYQDQQNYDKALEFFEQSQEISNEINDSSGIAYSLVSIGKIYIVKQSYLNAINQCSKGLEIAENLGDLMNQVDACNCLITSYKQLNNGSEALRYHEKLREIENGLQKQDVTKKLQEMEFKKQMLQDSIATAEKERLIELAHQEEVEKKNQTRNIALVAGLIVLVFAGGLYNRLRYVRRSKKVLEKEKDRSENLLLNILPAEVAKELMEKGKADARDFDMVSILFTDFVSFTETSEKLSATELVKEINTCFEAFDNILESHKIEKIKTIGDAYMAAGGLPVPSKDSVKNTVLAAIKMQDFISKRKSQNEKAGKLAFEMRVGIHTGPVVAGIVGVKKFQYDIWGDTVNTASRMESNGSIGKVNISEETYQLLKNDEGFNFEVREEIDVKGKGKMKMWFVSIKRDLSK